MKRIIWGLLSLLFVLVLYYLFVRPFEYEVRFKANTLPGDLIETIRIWNKSLDDARILKVDSFSTLAQTVVVENRTYTFLWNFKLQNDSVSQVSVQVSEAGNAFRNKILIPISEQPIEQHAGELMRNFYNVLKEHLEITRVKVIGEIMLDSVFCICRSLETSQPEKAYGMMQDFPVLTSFIQDFGLVTKGAPVVLVRHWNHGEGALKFDFCFPIIKQDSLPVYDSFFYTYVGGVRALKAEYYGNYITSDRAWYELIHFANRNGFVVTGFPMEYFHNNPNLGINEKEWKADIYLPVRN
ncbi:MAG: hypothetical protein KF687_10430 [Cyclobacteriaceae bacterium]|nr:hypothetical protein [Cyclobacteriaceae bacterium]